MIKQNKQKEIYKAGKNGLFPSIVSSSSNAEYTETFPSSSVKAPSVSSSVVKSFTDLYPSSSCVDCRDLLFTFVEALGVGVAAVGRDLMVGLGVERVEDTADELFTILFFGDDDADGVFTGMDFDLVMPIDGELSKSFRTV